MDSDGFSTQVYVDAYARKLVRCFPNQGRTVQEYIKRIPHLSSDLECTRLLERSVYRTPENAWVYVGLPDAKKTWELREEKRKKWNERSRINFEKWQRARDESIEKNRQERKRIKDLQEAARKEDLERANKATAPSP